MKFYSLFFFYFSVCSVMAQPAVYIAPFRYDTEGAYTLIHDDFGATHARGIEEYIDTMNYNRGLPICFAAITGRCDTEDWKIVNRMIAHGHQILNHSMTHQCGQPVDWCRVGTWDEKDFPIEIDSSTALIIQNTGKHPAFFVFPYDLFTDTMITYLEAIGYMGARSGPQNTLNPPELYDPFLLRYIVFRPGQAVTVLNDMVDETILKKSWGIRVMHGIEDDSWGHITAEEYATHLNHLHQLVKEKKLWMATLSDIVSYQYLKEGYKITDTQTGANGKISQFHLQPLKVKLPAQPLTLHTLTVVFNQSVTPKKILQNGKSMAFEVRGNKLIAELEAQPGDVILTY